MNTYNIQWQFRDELELFDPLINNTVVKGISETNAFRNFIIDLGARLPLRIKIKNISKEENKKEG